MTGNKAGLHLIKMFPVDKNYFEKFHIKSGSSYDLNAQITSTKTKEIVEKCQDYLNRVASSEFIKYRVNIDKVIEELVL